MKLIGNNKSKQAHLNKECVLTAAIHTAVLRYAYRNLLLVLLLT